MPTIRKLSELGDVLSPLEVRTVLGIGENSVYKLLKSGELKSFKIGREHKIPKFCLIEYIKNQVNDIQLT